MRRLAEIRFSKNRDQLTDLSKYSTIWTDNADNQGVALGYENNDLKKELGPVYGVQWRDWGGVDQIKELLKNIHPCHVMSQFYVSKGAISCHMYQRSADMFLGVPFNIASYSLLLCIFGKILNLKPKRFVHSFGDALVSHCHYQH